METQLKLQGIEDLALYLAREARKEGIALKLLGGIAVRVLSFSSRTEPFSRSSKDIDFITSKKSLPKLVDFFSSMGLVGREAFNKINMYERLIYYDKNRNCRIDVFVDKFRMCHEIPVRGALDSDGLTLPVTELLMTKLQIVMISERDIKDIASLLIDFNFGKSSDEIQLDKISGICSKSWGTCKTFLTNLQKVKSWSDVLDCKRRQELQAKVDKLTDAINSRKKSIVWKARSLIGERIKWYQLPEEVS